MRGARRAALITMKVISFNNPNGLYNPNSPHDPIPIPLMTLSQSPSYDHKRLALKAMDGIFISMIVVIAIMLGIDK